MIRYKLTDHDGYTRRGKINETRWEIWKTNEIDCGKYSEKKLCTEDVLHFYDSPEIAVFMNPIHANIVRPVCYAVEDHGTECAHDGTKGGAKKLTPVSVVPMPLPTTTQRVAFAIICAQYVIVDTCPAWSVWAENWLAGTNRTAEAAWAGAADEFRAFLISAAKRALEF